LPIERNIDLRLLPSYRDIPAENQLVPCYSGHNQVIPFRPRTSRALTVSGDPVPKRYTRLPLPNFSGKEIKTDPHETAYNSSRHIVAPKINQVGLLIDIYA
jgi:hypothetical protein